MIIITKLRSNIVLFITIFFNSSCNSFSDNNRDSNYNHNSCTSSRISRKNGNHNFNNLKNSIFIGTPSGTRTHTTISGQRILSPLCLPFHHQSFYQWSQQDLNLRPTDYESVASNHLSYRTKM